MKGDQAEEFAVAQIEITEAGGAETHRVCQHGVEHRLKLAWRTGDDAQHLGRGGLLLQQFAQLVEQACVLDGDDGLRREIRDQGNLFVREGLDLLSVDDDGADQCVVLVHWHCDQRSGAAEPGRHAGSRFGRFVRGIGHLSRLQDSVEGAARFRSEWPALRLEFDERGRRTDTSRHVE